LARHDGRAHAAAIEATLRGLGTPQRAASEKAYLKSDLESGRWSTGWRAT